MLFMVTTLLLDISHNLFNIQEWSLIGMSSLHVQFVGYLHTYKFKATTYMISIYAATPVHIEYKDDITGIELRSYKSEDICCNWKCWKSIIGIHRYRRGWHKKRCDSDESNIHSFPMSSPMRKVKILKYWWMFCRKKLIFPSYNICKWKYGNTKYVVF